MCSTGVAGALSGRPGADSADRSRGAESGFGVKARGLSFAGLRYAAAACSRPRKVNKWLLYQLGFFSVRRRNRVHPTVYLCALF